jgi:hypothetical protein
MDFMKVAIADRPNEHFAGDVRPLPSTNVALKTATTRPASQPAAVATPQ